MGEANFYYFTCLKLQYLSWRAPPISRMMAYSLAIVFTLATFAYLGSSLKLIDGWEGKVCAAYFKASGLDKSMYPAGQCWSDKVCVDDPSFYLVCELNNGVFTGEKRQCPPGKQFYHGANQMWEKTCVPADKCETNKQCPNWLGQSTPVPTPIYEGVKPLQCAAGFCWCVYADGTEIPNTKCETASSSLTDAKCALLRNEAPYQGVKPLQCGVGFCWCVYADGTKIP